MKRILEALLFAAEGPLSLAQLAQVLDTGDKEAVKAALEELKTEYEASARSFELVEVAGGYSLRTRPELAFWLRKLKREQVTKLSRAALETLAIVAYKQPVLKAEVERLRGVEVGGMLRTLMEKDLVRVAGRKDLPGRPLIYGTTRRFLEVFDLKDLKDLPTLEEMAALAGDQGELFGPGATADQEGEGESGQAPEPYQAEPPGGEEEPSNEEEEPSNEEETLSRPPEPGLGEPAYLDPPPPPDQGEADEDEDGDGQVDEDADCDPPPEAA